MTSLQHQLNRLAVPHVTQELEANKVSLLFDAKEVALLDSDAVLEFALEGLEELIKKNKSFAKYRNLLFNKESISFNRATCSKEVNQKLDKILLEYLVEVSPYFLLRSAQQTLEWLLYRHQINNFNMDDWIMTILPYHNSKIFVRVLMILNLEKPTGRWHWLNECAKHGMPLPRVVIVNHCKKDGGFFRYVLSNLSTFIEVLGNESSTLTERIDFCFKIMLELIRNATDITQESVAIILEFLTNGIKSKCKAWEAKCYEYLPRLMSTVTLTADKINHLCKIISKRHSEDLTKSVILTLNFLVMISESVVPAEAFAKFSFTRDKFQVIANLVRQFDILPILRLLKTNDKTGFIKSILDQLDQPEDQDHEKMEVDEVDQAVDPVQTEEQILAEEDVKKEEKLKYKTLSSKNIFEVISLLSSTNQATRNRCLKFLVAKHSKLEVHEAVALLKKIIKKKEEIGQDDATIARIFGKLFTADDLKKEKVQKCFNAVISFLLASRDISQEVELAILKCLSEVRLDEIKSTYLELADLHIKEFITGDKDSKHLTVITSILDIVMSHEASSDIYAKLLLQLLNTTDKQLTISATDSLHKFQNSFSDEDNDTIVKLLLDISLKSKGLFKSKVFKKFAFREDFISTELGLTRGENEPKLKKMRVNMQNIDVSKAIFLLEVMELPSDANEGRKVSNLLMTLLTSLTKESGFDVEYCRRLILVAIHKVVSSLSDMTGMQINVEILVQCLRCTSNLQTQKQVLILMTAIAPYYPRDLLYNIVSVFSFMGNEFLQNDDKYSFEILSSLIDVVMFSVKQLKDDSGEAKKTLLEVLRIFVDSRHHIPQHRLGPLVERLLSLDVDDYLWKVIVMIVESCICKRDSSSDEIEFKQLLNSEHDIISLVVLNYPLDTMLTLLINLVHFLRKILAEEKLEVINEALTKQPRLQRLMLYHLSKVVHLLLDRIMFFSQVEDSGRVKSLVQDTVQFMHDIDSKQKSVVKGSTNERFWPSLIKVVQNIFDRMNNFMPSKLFVEVVENLISVESIHVNCKGLELLNVHLIAIEKRGDASSSLNSLDLVPILVDKIIKVNASTDEGDSKMVLLSKQLSFLNLKLMMRVYGEEHWALFKDCYGPIALCMSIDKSSSVALVDSALLCFSDFVSVMKVKLLPKMDEIMTNIISLYGSNKVLESGVSLNCLNKAVVKLIVNLGKFFGKRLSELVVAIGRSLKAGISIEDFTPIFQALATNIETRVLIPSLEKCYKEMVKEDLRSVHVAFFIFRNHCKTLTKDGFTMHGESLQSLIGNFLIVRHEGRNLEGTNFDVLDNCLVEAVLPLIYLMSEISFKSMFNSYLAVVNANKESVVTFFKLMENIAGILRGLFGMFSKYLIPLIVETLKTSGPTLKACAVNIFKLVGLCHTNDRDDDFATKASEGLYQVLADMMDKPSAEMEAELIDCFVQMSQSIKDLDVSKALFEKIFVKLRHHSSKVKILALKVVIAVARVLQNVNDVFLQDVCPYVIEVIDDDNETVAKLGYEIINGPLKSILDNDMS